ncbi:tripartite tricarboxylate transporter permease [Alkalilacustris brevis]|uniref:tripartite tricarboxylate transporter permease n=1 Tax=Alkalilacustris brevis TaxID=2026338 RepID=UPI001EE3BDDD|nr:tripartite tricarboxylate transporter permease [Alkalilacustris brevis]
MDTLGLMLGGVQNALAPEFFLLCLVGVVVGMLVGVLPGIGAIAAISLALPITFHLDPTGALVMLAGIFYGTQYGGSTASILLNLPGTATAAVTCLDGYPMARKGKAGVALFITTITSFIGATVAILVMVAFMPVLARVALNFGAAEYFAVMFMGLIAASALTVGSPIKGLAMVVVGIALGLVGVDINSGQFRLIFGSYNLMDGISLVALAMGLFGVSEVFASMTRNLDGYTTPKVRLRDLIPSRDEFRASLMPAIRGAISGTLLGALPGVGASVTSFFAYAVEQKIARDPSRFGQGAIEGIAAPEAANNATTQASFIPTLSLGIPGDAVMAIMLGAMMIHGITPGPRFITDHDVMFWTLVGSFWVGNFLLLILNIPLVGIWVRILSVPRHILYPAVLFFVCVGVYSTRNNVFDIYLTLFFGFVGYLMAMRKYPPAPLLLGFVLGPMMEENLTRALVLSRGDPTVFFTRPISGTILSITLVVLAITLFGPLWRKHKARRAGSTPGP